VARILAFDAVAESVFGASVSVSASDSPTAVVGAPGGRPTAGNGEAYVLTDLQTLETHVPIGDSFVRRNHPDRNEGANPRLRINHSGRNRTVVEFAEIPAVANLRRATLVLTIAENSNNWGRDGGTVEAFQALSFPEGNGKAAGVPGSERTRGLGEGITWNCNVDLAIENDRPDCGEPSEVLGPLADPVLHFNGLRGEVAWDVTVDVMRHTRAWIIRKAEESRSGEVWYYSREGARDAGNPDLAPRLVLEFDVPAPRDAAAGAVETARNARPSWGPADPRRASPNEIARPRARRPGA
jgi:hypothetical protein